VLLACSAIYGLIIIVRRKYSAKFLSAFCVATLLAFAVETVFFNYKHYLKYFAGEEFSLTISFKNQTRSDSTMKLTLSDDNDVGVGVNVLDYENGERSIRFKNINRKVTSVFIQPTFSSSNMLRVRMNWEDESDTQESVRGFIRTLYKNLPHENYIDIQTCGKVSIFEIIFEKQRLLEDISQITVNKQIPFYFSGLRLFVVSLLFFTIILFVYKPIRAKAAYYLFEYRFDSMNKKQTIVYVGLVILTIFFSWFCDYTADPNYFRDHPANNQSNKHLVDAFIAGKTNLDIGHPEKLLNAKNPYNFWWLASNGFVDYRAQRLDGSDDYDYVNDLCYYNGRFYSYYGVVPVVFLYLPYRLITGNYLSHHAGVFVFTSIAAVLLALLWRYLVKKYMPNALFMFVALSFLTLFFAGYLFDILRLPCYLTIVQVAGIAFIYAGIFLLLKAVDEEKINYLQLFFACLCLALAVGCRPNMILASILVPVVLYKRRSWKLALFILIPYIIVAIPQCIYNYMRFDSIFEIGHKYDITTSDASGIHLLNPLGKIHRTLELVIIYFFRLYNYSFHFPFVELVIPQISKMHPIGTNTHDYSFILTTNNGGGLINFPILFCMFYLIKNILNKDKPNGFCLSLVFIVIGIAMILLYANIAIFHERYLVDCAVFFILPSLFGAYYWTSGRGVVCGVCGGGGGGGGDMDICFV
jgi:hypothetical protein